MPCTRDWEEYVLHGGDWSKSESNVLSFFIFVPFCFLLWTNCFHQLLISQSVLTTWIVDRHFGHLCVVDLHLSMQKGMRQQPAMQLQKKKQEQNKQIRKHMNSKPPYKVRSRWNCKYFCIEHVIPDHGCHETHQPGQTGDGSISLCHDELPTLRTLCLAWKGRKFFQIQNNCRGYLKEQE